MARVALVVMMVACLAVVCSPCLTGCGPGPAVGGEPPGGSEPGGGGVPGGGRAPGAGGGGGVPAREWTPGEAGVVEVRAEANVAAAGPFRQLYGLMWVGEGELLALARHEGGESILRFSCQAGGAWEGRAVLTLKEGVTPEHFYMWAPLAGGKSIVFTSLQDSVMGPLWRYDAEPSGADERGVYKVAERVNAVFRMSPDGTRAVLYDNDGASVMDFRTGQRLRLPGVPAYEFPFVGIGSSWSPDSIHYLYQVVEGQVTRWFGIVRTDTAEVVRKVAPEKGCAFGAVWSPAGSRVAFLALDGKADAFLGPEEELIPPIAYRVGILEVKSGRVEYVSLPGKLVYGLPVWSPAGDALAFGAGTVEGNRTGGFRVSCDVHVAEERNGKWTVAQVTGRTEGGGDKIPLSWAPRGGALAFSVPSPGGEGSLRVGVVRKLAGSWGAPVMLGEVDAPVVWLGNDALAGRVVLPGREYRAGELRVFSLDGGVVSVLEGAGVLRAELAPSPDGRYLAFIVETLAPDGSASTALLRIRPAR
ncbi:MAG: hypothetical protein AB1446_01385 [Bacillota bacterium]